LPSFADAWKSGLPCTTNSSLFFQTVGAAGSTCAANRCPEGIFALSIDISIRKQAELRLKLQHAVTSVLAEAGSSTEINPKILETLCRGLHAETGPNFGW